MEFNFDMNKDNDKSTLKDIGKNLTDLAAQGKLDPIIGRDAEIRRIIRILSRKTKNNPILVGDPGVGKTAIAEGLAMKIVEGNVPEDLKDKEIIEIDMGSLIAGSSFQGQFEKKLKNLLKEIKNSNGNKILFIDEIHTIIGTGKNSQGSLDAAQILKPYLARGEIKLIGATTFDEYKKYIENDAAFERRLQKIIVEEPSAEESITILRGLKERFETYHGVKIQDRAIVAAVNLATRYITDRFLPDKAIDLIDESAANIKTEMHSKPIELEKLESKLALYKMELLALDKENDIKYKKKIKELETLIEDISLKSEKIKKEWQGEKEIFKKITELKEKIETYKTQQNKYQNEGEYEKASVILYKEVPLLELELEKLEENAKNRELHLIKEKVTEDEIASVVSKWAQIPIKSLLTEEKDRLLNLEENLNRSIIGQDKAISLVSESILRSKADINDPNKPIASFIFMGPTGVGKTELSKKLSLELFHSEKNLIRVDMSEYMEKSSITKIIGSAPGYVGFDNTTSVCEAVRNKPYSIVLFDEIEKGHPDVLNLLLQIMDNGMITTSKGKKVNFRNTIIIMTTNIGSLDILDGKDEESTKVKLRKFLKPEFINRIDETIVFETLGKQDIKKIIKNELKILSNRIEKNDYKLEFTDNIIKNILEKSYDPVYGARPIKRYIRHNVETALAKKIISEGIVKGFKYTCDIIGNEITFYSKNLN